MKQYRSRSKHQRRSVSRPKTNCNLLQNSQTYSMIIKDQGINLNNAKRKKNPLKKVTKKSALLNLKNDDKKNKIDSLKQKLQRKSILKQYHNNTNKNIMPNKRNASVKLNSNLKNFNLIPNKSINELFLNQIRSDSQTMKSIKQRSKSIAQDEPFENLKLKQKVPIEILYQKCKQNMHYKGKFQIGKISNYYSAICSKGLLKNVNEDKFLVITNKKINNKDQSIFAVFDGHCADKKKVQICSEFAKQNFFKIYEKFSKEKSQLTVPKLLEKSLQQIEDDFTVLAMKQNNKSGSCANVIVIENKTITCANVGDSKTIVVEDNGKKIVELSKDHKPTQSKEKQRILKNGGQVKQNNNKGVYRVFPGGLAVSRALGNVHMKYNKNNVKNFILISDADTQQYQINSQSDFLVQSSDGIYQKLTPNQIAKIFVEEIQNLKKQKILIQEKVDLVLKNSMQRILKQNLTDNLTVLFVLFKLDVLRS